MNFSNIEFKSTHVEDTNRFRFIMASVYISIMCFFLILVSISTINKAKSTKITSELRKKFSYDYQPAPFVNENNIKKTGSFQNFLSEINNSLAEHGLAPYSYNNNGLQVKFPISYLQNQYLYDGILKIVKGYASSEGDFSAKIIIALPYNDEESYSQQADAAANLVYNMNSYLKLPANTVSVSLYSETGNIENFKLIITNEY